MTAETSALCTSIQSAVAIAEAHSVFDRIRKRPPVATLVGLLLGQGRSFVVARRQRQRLAERLFGSNRKEKDEKDAGVKAPDCDLQTVLSIDDTTWKQWRVSKSTVEAVRSICTMWWKGADVETILTEGKRIGPWTRKAYRIMCTDAKDQLLTEDPWIRKRWSEITASANLTTSLPLTVETCQLLQVEPTTLSRLLWRLTQRGAVRLGRQETLNRSAFL